MFSSVFKTREKVIEVWSKSRQNLHFVSNYPLQYEIKDILKSHAGQFELAKGKKLLEGNLFIKIMC